MLITLISNGQSKKDNWHSVRVYELVTSNVPDSLVICGGEWFVKAEATSITELDDLELERIKKKVAAHGCDIVFVDVKKIFTPRDGQLYIVGLKRK